MIEIPVREKIDAELTLPGSKSITNRALVIAALARGETILSNWLESEDTSVMIRCLSDLGFSVSPRGGELHILGRGGEIPPASARLDTINSGTTMRFLCGLTALGKGVYVLDGNPRMRQRPIEPLLGALRQLGVEARSLEGTGCPPVEIRADGLRGGDCELPGGISSQFLSALLLSSPYAENDTTILLEGPLASAPYIRMTLAMMREFGVSVEEHELQSFHVPSGQTYRGRPYPVEGDASSATYFWAAAAITAGRVKISNVGTDSIQGDARFVEVLEQMGATVRRGGGGREVSGPLRRGIEIDLNDMPDTVPTLAVTALFAPGRTVITNVANLRYKESDRLRALVTELRKLGARAEELPDGLTVEGGELRGAQIDTYDDHRIAMAFSLAGLKIPGVKIKNPGCVGKTFPGFFDLFLSL